MNIITYRLIFNKQIFIQKRILLFHFEILFKFFKRINLFLVIDLNYLFIIKMSSH